MPRRTLRRFRPTFTIHRIAYEKLDIDPVPSTIWLSHQAGPWHNPSEHKYDALKITREFTSAVADEVAAAEDKISKLTGQAEHLLAYLGSRPERRGDFTDQAESLLTVLVAELRKIVPRTSEDTPLP